MGKIEHNKHKKAVNLIKSASELFLKNGIEKTSVADITRNAGVAKGTFYLYFQDKYELRDYLISYHTNHLFRNAYAALQNENISSIENQIIFLVNYALSHLHKNPSLLEMLSEKLSWGLFHRAITSFQIPDNEADFLSLYYNMLKSDPDIRFKDPEIMLFMIVEIASTVSYNTFLNNHPVSFDEISPYLDQCIRNIIAAHKIS